MQFHARLLHCEAGLRVVQVRACDGERLLGSALAEAPTAQLAEDLALSRLLQRLADPETGAQAPMAAGAVTGISEQGPSAMPEPRDSGLQTARGTRVASRELVRHRREDSAAEPTNLSPTVQAELPHTQAGRSSQDVLAEQGLPSAMVAAETEQASTPQTSQRPPNPARTVAKAPHVPEPAEPTDEAGTKAVVPDHAGQIVGTPPDDPHEEPPADPEDWSHELTAVDLQLRRLGWARAAEGTYLQRAFGHPSRSRLTRYSDLRAYLTALEALGSDSDPSTAPVPLLRRELLAQGDTLLQQLGWDAGQGRALLERELQRSSRQQLSDVQLLQFNMLLEGELLAGGEGSAASRTEADGAQR